MMEEFVKFLIQNKITISTAESCTGGIIAKQITDVPGASSVFLGSVVSYSDEMKIKMLNVKKETLQEFGSVSESTVREMLEGIDKITASDIGIAISGIAGPGGGTEEKPVGTVFIGINIKGNINIRRMIFSGNRNAIREKSAAYAINMVDDYIRKSAK
ncbi:nicotinamide-nucleotide amidohydrolase family protein [candidate division KSB1 bacterium]|nr:nicotinamide-nucleotide amidohydrolase family protein [candidate division KSB1 bacterium]